MTFAKIFDINHDFLRLAENRDFMDGLSPAIERKLAGLDDMEGLPYAKSDVIQLIESLETDKVRFLKGEISATRLYRGVDSSLSRFKIKHPGFDTLKDPAMNIYFS